MDWTKFAPASCLPNCWCEATRTGELILEPVNTATNLSFVLVGLVLLINTNKYLHQGNKLAKTPALIKLYGYALILLGLGSIFFHMSQTFVGQWFDVMGMYFVGVFYIFYNFMREDKISLSRFKRGYILSLVFLGLILYLFAESRRYLFGAMILFTFVQTLITNKKIQSKTHIKYFVLATVSFLLAFMFWNLDKSGAWCNPYSWINGHGLWHILCATATYFIFKYFQSEEVIA